MKAVPQGSKRRALTRDSGTDILGHNRLCTADALREKARLLAYLVPGSLASMTTQKLTRTQV